MQLDNGLSQILESESQMISKDTINYLLNMIVEVYIYVYSYTHTHQSVNACIEPLCYCIVVYLLFLTFLVEITNWK